jgi:SAM-dependent methyltransferase
MADFFVETLQRLLQRGTVAREMRVLVVCGGDSDRDALLTVGFKDVTITNLDTRMVGDEFSPYAWGFEDAESLSYGDEEFDVCIVHWGLHHCRSPHRALVEMYRVSKVGILVFEPRDSVFARGSLALGIGQEYETAAVFDNDCRFGGVRNSEIPNYVYRFSEHEVKKCIRCYDPAGRPRFQFFYRTEVPCRSLQLRRNKLYLVAAAIAIPVLKLINVVYPRLCNNFAFFVAKPTMSPADIHGWIERRGGERRLNKNWLFEHYGPAESNPTTRSASEICGTRHEGALVPPPRDERAGVDPAPTRVVSR